MADKYVSDFKKKFDALHCRELTGVDIKTSAGFKEYYAKVPDYACVDRISFAVKEAVEILQD